MAGSIRTRCVGGPTRRVQPVYSLRVDTEDQAFITKDSSSNTEARLTPLWRWRCW